jgi:hypothetical protein
MFKLLAIQPKKVKRKKKKTKITTILQKTQHAKFRENPKSQKEFTK